MTRNYEEKLKWVILPPLFKQTVKQLKIKHWEISEAIGVTRCKVTIVLNGGKVSEIDANRMAEYIAWREKGKPKAFYLNEKQIKSLKELFKGQFIEEAEVFLNQN